MSKVYPNIKGEALLTCTSCPQDASKIHWPISQAGMASVTIHTFQMRGELNEREYGMIYQCGECEKLRIWG